MMQAKVQGFSSLVSRSVEKVVNWSFLLSALLLFAMSIPITADVTYRNAFGFSLPGIIECEELLLMWIVFLAISHPQFANESHISVDILFMHFGDTWKKSLLLMHWICIFVMVSLMTYYVTLSTVAKYKAHEFTPELFLPLWIFYIVPVVALAMLALCFLISMIRAADWLRRRRHWGGIILAVAAAAGLLALPYLLHGTEFSCSFGKVGSLYTILLVALILLRMPIAFAMSLAGLLGMMTVSITPEAGMILLMSTPSATVSFTLTVIPMFILMGELVFCAGIGEMLFRSSRIWLGTLPGGLAISGVAGCAGFAAICGESMATALTMASVALPEMRKYDYDPGLACASLAAGGTLGILIPPSIGFIMYALLTEESVGRLFVAGLVPGLLLTTMFCMVIYIIARLRPELAPRGLKSTAGEKLRALVGFLPMGFLVLLILGGILSGLFSPTEGGAIGVVGTLLYAMALRVLSVDQFKKALKSSADLTTKVMAILIGVHLLGNFFAMTQLPTILSEVVLQFTSNKYIVLFLVVIIYIILGMLMNVIPMILLTLPAIFPTVLALGIDPVWFGVFMVVLMEMGAITPPVGLVVFAISAVSEGVPLVSIFKYVSLFVACQLLLLLLLVLFPDLALWMPRLFYGG